jgi:hypothetical protein
MTTPAHQTSMSQRLHRLFACVVGLCFVLSSMSMPVLGQVSQVAPAGTQHLYINILEGEGALNNIRQRDAREPVVQVTDENHKPVAGVALLFLIHGGSSGATATFEGGLSFSTTTDAQGIAHAVGLHLGTHPGSFTISVTASVNGVVAATSVIHESNIITALNSAASSTSSTASTASNVGSTVAKHGLLHLSKTALIATGSAVAATAVVVTVVVVTKSDSTSLTLGSSTVGHP